MISSVSQLPPQRTTARDDLPITGGEFRRVMGHLPTGVAVVAALVFAALTIFWRVAPVVDFLVGHPWLVVVESVSLVALGVVLFADLVESPPLTPGASRPYRIGIAAGVMWTAWVVAYLNGMSHNSWYHAFHHVAGRGVSLSADQQLSAGFIWLLSGAVFVPIIFWNLVYWLQSGEDPNEELGRLVRDERARGFIPGSAHIPLDELRQRLSELPRDRKIIAYCQSGQRSYIATRILRQHGFRAANLSGGYTTFRHLTAAATG